MENISEISLDNLKKIVEQVKNENGKFSVLNFNIENVWTAETTFTYKTCSDTWIKSDLGEQYPISGNEIIDEIVKEAKTEIWKKALINFE